jgi:hypothetical protein
MFTERECRMNTDPYRDIREGTSQDQRASAALDASYAPVNEHTPAHGMVFAQSYAAMLRYVNAANVVEGDWQPFFCNDVSAQLALVAVEDIDAYKSVIKSWFDYLNKREHQHDHDQLKDTLGFLFSTLGTMAVALDTFKEHLPVAIGLKSTLQNLIKTRLAPAFKRLITYYNAGKALHLVHDVAPSPSVLILRTPVVSFDAVLASGLSTDWSEGLAWGGYLEGMAEDDSVYGAPPDTPAGKVFIQINHCSTHNLFTSVFDQFLKVFARIITEASRALDDTLTKWDTHEPHYALFLAFLRLFEYVRAESNTLTRRHLDFYYREILRLKEKPAQPGQVHLLIELAKHAALRECKAGELFKAGKDNIGRDLFFANDHDVVVNQAKVVALKTLYRHSDENIGAIITNSVYNDKFRASSRHLFLHNNFNHGRIYALPVANAGDQSWHPFFNKVYNEGVLQEIQMPEAEIGFAVASHYLLLAEGHRTITVQFTLADALSEFTEDHRDDVTCSLTTAKGWLTGDNVTCSFKTSARNLNVLELIIELSGDAPAIAPYAGNIHGYSFGTNLPVIVVTLKHRDDAYSIYPLLQDTIIQSIDVTVDVKGLKTLALSNDFGPIDASKPFQPFGALPLKGNALIIGSKEVFQKMPEDKAVSADIIWQIKPLPYNTAPEINVEFLSQGSWKRLAASVAHNKLSLKKGTPVSTEDVQIDLSESIKRSILDSPDFNANEHFSISARRGFIRLVLTDDFGNAEYQTDLIDYLVSKDEAKRPKSIPIAPTIASLTLGYTASTTLSPTSVSSADYQNRGGRFFHLAPFGQAEQHPFSSSKKTVTLLPQFSFMHNGSILKSEAELYIGISGVKLPQNLSILFQVEDGTANPLASKPKPHTQHIHWSYLRNNEWRGFADNNVQDGTDGWLNSGLITFAVPEEATNNNTLLTQGFFWIRASVSEKSDAVCKLQLVAAQALQASFVDHGNSATFSDTPLPEGSISKLARPDAGVKAVSQPFTSFGGRGAEQAVAFTMRISERLRHKNRAITRWDYERLILEAFPQLYRVKCLNHTHYETSENGAGLYRELAPGHVTIVTIPNVQFRNLRDPLRPYTSLGLLDEIEAFVKKRLGCFAVLHVKNPQFEEVRVSFKLRLYDGFDETYYVTSLQETITRFLSPWAFAEGGMLSFGGKIYKSVLINFIEDQPYVDYVTDVQLFLDINGESSSIDHPSEVEGSRAVSVLVSAPAIKHNITLITSTLENISGKTCQCEA